MHDSPPKRTGHLMTLVHAAEAMQRHAEARLAAVRLSLPKLAALTALSQAGASLPLSQLAESLSCVKSNITQLVDRLEADGFVTRAADPNDRRSRLAVMTPAGREAYEKGSAILQEAERDLVARLGAEGARTLATLLGKLAG